MEGTTAPVGIVLIQIGKNFLESYTSLDDHSFVVSVGVKYLEAIAAHGENPLAKLLTITAANATKAVNPTLAVDILSPLFDDFQTRASGLLEKNLVESCILACSLVREVASLHGGMRRESESVQRIIIGEYLKAIVSCTHDLELKRIAGEALRKTPNVGLFNGIIQKEEYD